MDFLISAAYAAGTAAAPATAVPPSPGEVFMLNMMMIVAMVVLFYVLLIMPQQKRFKKHRGMLDSLKKGDKVITAAGFIATVDKVPEEGSSEVALDLGNGVKVTALRHTIQNRADDVQETSAAPPRKS